MTTYEKADAANIATEAVANNSLTLSPSDFCEAVANEVINVSNFYAKTKRYVEMVINGAHKSLILQGHPGLGKSHVVQEALNSANKILGIDYVVVKGHLTTMQLFRILAEYRAKGKVVVLDDCDCLFGDEVALGILKAALEQTGMQVCYESSRIPLVNNIPTANFLYEGTLIVCTNIDFRINRRGRVAEHMRAIESRTNIWPVVMQSKEKQFANIYYFVVERDYLSGFEDANINSEEKVKLLGFIWKNLSKIRNLDLRLPIQIATQIKTDPEGWTGNCCILLGIDYE